MKIRGIRDLMLAALVVCTLQFPVAAQAGLLEVFGDVNSISDGSAASTQLLRNLLGVGTRVVESQKIPLDFPPAGTFSDYYNSLAGVTGTLSNGTVDAALLTGVDLLFLNMGCCQAAPVNPYSASEISTIAQFLQGGGRVGLLAEPCCFDGNKAAYLNSMLTALGSTIQAVDWTGDGGLATMGPSPLAAGAAGYSPNTFVYYSGGTSVASRNGLSMVVEETIVANVPVPATLALFCFGLAGLGLSRRR